MREVHMAVEAAGGAFLPVQLLPSQEALLGRVTSESRLGKKIDTHARWHEVVGDNPAAFEAFPDMPHCVLDNSTMPPADAARQIIEYYGL